jgi:hypothetical protein
MYKAEIEIPVLPKMLNGFLRMHFFARKRENERWRMLIAQYFLEKPKRPLKRASITLTRYSSRTGDFDGIVASFKPTIDALVRNGILADDSMAVLGKWDVRWHFASPKQGKIKIIVEEI